MNGMISYPTYDDCKILNEAILKYGYWPDYNKKLKIRDEDLEDLDEVLPLVISCGVVTCILEKIIYPDLKINETALG